MNFLKKAASSALQATGLAERPIDDAQLAAHVSKIDKLQILIKELRDASSKYAKSVLAMRCVASHFFHRMRFFLIPFTFPLSVLDSECAQELASKISVFYAKSTARQRSVNTFATVQAEINSLSENVFQVSASEGRRRQERESMMNAQRCTLGLDPPRNGLATTPRLTHTNRNLRPPQEKLGWELLQEFDDWKDEGDRLKEAIKQADKATAAIHKAKKVGFAVRARLVVATPSP